MASSGMLTDIDLLVLNADEAAAFTGGNDNTGAAGSSEDLARRSIERLLARNDRLSIVITAGVSGSWCWNGETTEHASAILAPVRSTAVERVTPISQASCLDSLWARVCTRRIGSLR